MMTGYVEERVVTQVRTFAELYGRANASGELLIPFRFTQSDLASLGGANQTWDYYFK